jgi:hypothetical protein
MVPIGVGVGIGIGIVPTVSCGGPHAHTRSTYGMHPVRYASGFSYPNPILSFDSDSDTDPDPDMIPTAIGTGLSCIENMSKRQWQCHPLRFCRICRETIDTDRDCPL